MEQTKKDLRSSEQKVKVALIVLVVLLTVTVITNIVLIAMYFLPPKGPTVIHGMPDYIYRAITDTTK